MSCENSPAVIGLYNHIIDGVDKHGFLVLLYRTSIRAGNGLADSISYSSILRLNTDRTIKRVFLSETNWLSVVHI